MFIFHKVGCVTFMLSNVGIDFYLYKTGDCLPNTYVCMQVFSDQYTTLE